MTDQFWLVLTLVAVLLGLAVLVMSVGALAGRRCLRGSCGGHGDAHPDDPAACAACPNRRR